MTQTEISFDIAEGEQRKEAGLQLAAMERDELLKSAKELAVWMANAYGTVTYDDVFHQLMLAGLHPEMLGNAAGSVFRGKEWRFTGRWEKSARVSNHARVNRVWELA